MSAPETIPCPRYRCRKAHRVMRKYGPPHDHIQQYKCPKGHVKNRRVYCWFGMHKYKIRLRGRKHSPKTIRCQNCGEPKRVGGK